MKVERMKPKTKEQLVAENKAQEDLIKRLDARSLDLRERFTSVLGGITYIKGGWSDTSKVVTLSWEEIFFKIGELNSDANYSIVLGEKIRLQQELESLKNPKEPSL